MSVYEKPKSVFLQAMNAPNSKINTKLRSIYFVYSWI